MSNNAVFLWHYLMVPTRLSYGRFSSCTSANGLFPGLSYHICLYWNGNALFHVCCTFLLVEN